MDGSAILVVAAAVVALTQILKWMVVSDRYGPIVVITASFAGVGFWGWSQGDFNQTTSFGYFAGWVAVATSAAGVFGFTRAGAGAVTNATAPPASGAGSSPTTPS